jgi:hypothetical protein
MIYLHVYITSVLYDVTFMAACKKLWIKLGGLFTFIFAHIGMNSYIMQFQQLD